MNYCYVEFRVRSPEQYSRLNRTVEALRAAKSSDSFPGDDEWKSFFSEEEIATFWWPSEAEKKDWERRWLATPVETRFTDPSLDTPWDFGSMLDAIKDAEFSIIGLRAGSHDRGFLEFDPEAYPFGGTGSLRALILAYGHELVGYDDGTGYTQTTKA